MPKKTEPIKGPIYTEYMPLNILKKWPRNPKEHDLGLLHQSMDRWGYVEQITINETNGMIIAGHGRLDALIQKKENGDTAPERIVEKDGEWYVPVERGINLEEKEGEAYTVASNRHVELGGWNDAALADVLRDQMDDLAGIGFDDNDIQDMAKRTDLSLDMPDAGEKGGQVIECPKCGFKWKGRE